MTLRSTKLFHILSRYTLLLQIQYLSGLFGIPIRDAEEVADPKRQQELQLWKQRCEVGNPTRREKEWRERKVEKERRDE